MGLSCLLCCSLACQTLWHVSAGPTSSLWVSCGLGHVWCHKQQMWCRTGDCGLSCTVCVLFFGLPNLMLCLCRTLELIVGHVWCHKQNMWGRTVDCGLSCALCVLFAGLPNLTLWLCRTQELPVVLLWAGSRLVSQTANVGQDCRSWACPVCCAFLWPARWHVSAGPTSSLWVSCGLGHVWCHKQNMWCRTGDCGLSCAECVLFPGLPNLTLWLCRTQELPVGWVTSGVTNRTCGAGL